MFCNHFESIHNLEQPKISIYSSYAFSLFSSSFPIYFFNNLSNLFTYFFGPSLIYLQFPTILSLP